MKIESLIKNSNPDSIPPGIKKILEQSGGLEKFEKAILGLTNRPKKVLTLSDVKTIYIKGLERQPIRVVKELLFNHGLDKSYVKNISFFNKDICELVIVKRYEKTFREVFSFLNSLNKYEILENFNPLNSIGKEEVSEKEIQRIEKGYYNRINKIIEREHLPDYLKDYFKNVLQKTNFTIYTNSNEEIRKRKEREEEEEEIPNNKKGKGREEEEEEEEEIPNNKKDKGKEREEEEEEEEETTNNKKGKGKGKGKGKEREDENEEENRKNNEIRKGTLDSFLNRFKEAGFNRNNFNNNNNNNNNNDNNNNHNNNNDNNNNNDSNTSVISNVIQNINEIINISSSPPNYYNDIATTTTSNSISPFDNYESSSEFDNTEEDPDYLE